MPTILDVLGYETPGGIDGQSLLRDDHGKAREVISESFPNGEIFNWHERFRRVERAVFSGS
jgi:arylsulfatase A-like enzyme